MGSTFYFNGTRFKAVLRNGATLDVALDKKEVL